MRLIFLVPIILIIIGIIMIIIFLLKNKKDNFSKSSLNKDIMNCIKSKNTRKYRIEINEKLQYHADKELAKIRDIFDKLNFDKDSKSKPIVWGSSSKLHSYATENSDIDIAYDCDKNYGSFDNIQNKICNGVSISEIEKELKTIGYFREKHKEKENSYYIRFKKKGTGLGKYSELVIQLYPLNNKYSSEYDSGCNDGDSEEFKDMIYCFNTTLNKRGKQIFVSTRDNNLYQRRSSLVDFCKKNTKLN